MTRFEIQLNGTFHYVVAATQEDARVAFLASLTAAARRWANPIFTGRDIAGY